MIESRDVAQRLRPFIRDVPDFPKPGIVFRDITRLLGDAAALRTAVDEIAAAYASNGVDIVAGIESRGFILGGAVAIALRAGFVPIRKQGRLPGPTVSASYSLEYGDAVVEMHADALKPAQRVLIIDDLLATGGTAAAAASLVEQLGGSIVGIAFLVELTELGGARALAQRPYLALIRL